MRRNKTDVLIIQTDEERISIEKEARSWKLESAFRARNKLK